MAGKRPDSVKVYLSDDELKLILRVLRTHAETRDPVTYQLVNKVSAQRAALRQRLKAVEYGLVDQQVAWDRINA